MTTAAKITTLTRSQRMPERMAREDRMRRRALGLDNPLLRDSLLLQRWTLSTRALARPSPLLAVADTRRANAALYSLSVLEWTKPVVFAGGIARLFAWQAPLPM